MREFVGAANAFHARPHCTRADGCPSLWILLDAGLLVLDVQRRHDALGNDTGAKPARRAAGQLAVQYQADLARAADIEVLADH